MKAFVFAIAGLVWAVSLLSWVEAASASILCRDVAGQEICLESIKRSAKYAWEYRVVLKVDGQTRPIKRYDCRQQTELDPESASLNSEAALQQFICALVTR
ncbi:MAG: hypothetical protein KME14_03645 [Tildeniella torsiva UHER 1998/13D]|nr:hypothetical protein [Tildeniella torsiva UHER 1998/13D]